MFTLDLNVAQNFLIALLIGALIGIEREKSHATDKEASFAGLRTFILFSMTGAISAWISMNMQSPWVFIAALLGICGIVIAGYIQENRINPNSTGLTTEIAALTVTLLGGACVFGHAALAVPLAIATSAVLAFKQPLHELVGRLDRDDIYAGLKLLIATFIILPFLPDHPVDPWNALNPFKLWLLVIFISGISLVGYIAVSWLGTARGLLLTSLAGGLVSSTAVTLNFAQQSRTEKKKQTLSIMTAGILLSWVIMFLRVIVEVSVVSPGLLPRMAAPFALMSLASGAFVLFFYWQSLRQKPPKTEPTAEIPVKNPFSLTAAIKFGAFFALILLVVRLTQIYLHAAGLYLVAVLVGLTDVDAITLSMAELANNGGNPVTASNAIVIASMSNTVVKGAIVVALGDKSMRKQMVFATGVIVLTGLGALFV